MCERNGRPWVEQIDGSEEEEEEEEEADDGEGAEAAAAELATIFSFTAGRNITAQSRLLTAVTVALPRHTEPAGDAAPRSDADDDEKRKTWRGERSLMLFRHLIRLGTSLGSSPAAAAAAAPAPAAAPSDPRFASGGLGVGFGVVDGGYDYGYSDATSSSSARRVDAYRWYRSAMRTLVHDAIHIIPAIATAAADVLLAPMDVAAIRESHTHRRAATIGVRHVGDNISLPADLDASHRRAIGAATALESLCRWRVVESEHNDVGVGPLRWEVVVGRAGPFTRVFA